MYLIIICLGALPFQTSTFCTYGEVRERDVYVTFCTHGEVRESDVCNFLHLWGGEVKRCSLTVGIKYRGKAIFVKWGHLVFGISVGTECARKAMFSAAGHHLPFYAILPISINSLIRRIWLPC